MLVLAIVFMVTPSVPPFIVFILLIASAVLFFISSRGSYYFSKAYKIFKAGDIVPANMGILLKGAPGTYDYEPTFYFEAPYAPGNNLLEGSTENMQLPESDDLYYMLSYDDNGENIGFYWGANFGRPFLNKAHHAYFALPKSEAAGAKAFQLGPNPSTGIGTVVENDGTTATVYTLTGTKVTTPVDDLPRGIYIINEKKTLIK